MKKKKAIEIKNIEYRSSFEKNNVWLYIVLYRC